MSRPRTPMFTMGQPATPIVPFTDLRPDPAVAAAIREAIDRVLNRSWYILGDELEAFEAEFAAYCGVRHCVGVGNGSDAIHLALRALEIGPGDEVITVAHTFIATGLAISWTGATPVFVDVDPITYTMDPHRIAEAITPKTRAIIPVHLYGQCADMDGIRGVARTHGLFVVEDAAQAHGASYRGAKAGTMGDLGCFSFYPTKNLGACGDAGAVVTDDGELADRLRRLRNYGQTVKYRHDTLGFNTRLDDIQAAILQAKLLYLDEDNRRRQRVADAYRTGLTPVITQPTTGPGRDHVYHLYVIQTINRSGLQTWLTNHGIGTQVHYPRPLHAQPVYRDGTHQAFALPVTESIASRVLSLPMYPTLTCEQIETVVAAVNDYAY